MTRTAEHMVRKTPGAGLKDFEHRIDMARIRRAKHFGWRP